ncbi:MAG: tetratricopeptide repeat protein [Kiritimatiellia bacterium]|nr:tetratricopeptide repeat protein [Kiritimatiellia bacterium]
MARPSQDIYRSREKDRILLAPREPGPDEMTWFRRAGGNRWGLVVLTAFLAGILIAGVLVVLHQRSALRNTRTPTAHSALKGSRVELKVGTANRLSVELDPQGELLLDELDDVVVRDVPSGSPPELTAAWVKQAGYHLRNAELEYRDKNWSAAVSHYRQAQSILPGIRGIDRMIGLALLRMGSFDQAEICFEAEVAQSPESSSLRNNLGVCRMGQGKFEQAEQDFLETLRLHPNYAPARRNLALLYFRAEQMEPAVLALDQALVSTPNDAELLHMKAIALIRLKRWTEASALLEECARTMPESAPIFFRLAEVRAHDEKPDQALEALQQAIALVDARRAMIWLSRGSFDLLREHPGFQSLVVELSRAIP